MKKVILITLTLILAVCVGCGFAACDDPAGNGSEPLDENGSALEYAQVADGYAVVGPKEGCTDTTLVIPSGHNGKPVTEIGEEAFLENETITEVVFPKTLKRIDTWAFAGSTALESVVLPDGLEKLGGAAFSNCDALRTVHIPASVKEIGQSVFAYNSALETVTADEGLKCFGDYMFMYCTALTSVEFPEGLEKLGYGAFTACTSLAEIDLPSTLRVVDGFAFAFCPIDDVVIPDSVWHIGSMAFAQDQGHVKTLKLGNGLLSIGSHAFAYSAIEYLELPESLVDLGSQSFMGCASLKGVKFGNLVTYISYASFANCEALEWVIVPPVVTVCDTAFGGSENLKYVYYSGSDEVYDQNANETNQYRVGAESNDNPANMYGNKYYMEAKLCFYSEEPNADGNHWHYNADGMPEIWSE